MELLEDRLARKTMENQDYAAKVEQLAPVLENMARTKARICAEREALETEIAATDTFEKEIQESLEKMETKISVITQDIRLRKTSIRTKAFDLEDRKDRLARAKRDVESVRRKNERLGADLNLIESKLDELERERERVANERTDLREALDPSRRGLAEAEFQSKIRELDRRRIELDASVSSLKARREMSLEREEELKIRLDSEIKRSDEQEKQNKLREHQIMLLSETIEREKIKRTELVERLDESEARRATLQRELSEMHARCEEITAMIQKQEMEKVEKAQRAKLLIENTNDQRKKLRVEMDALGSAQTKLAKLQATQKKLEATRGAKGAACDVLREEIAQLDEAKTRDETKLSVVRKRLTTSERRLERERQEISRLRTNLEETESNREKIELEVRKAEHELESLGADLAKLDREKGTIASDVRLFEEARSKRVRERKAHEMKMCGVLQDRESTITSLQADASRIASERDAMAKRLDIAKRELLERTRELGESVTEEEALTKSLRSQLWTAERQLSMMQHDVANSASRMNMLRTKLDGRKKEEASMSVMYPETLGRVRGDLEHATSELSTLRKDIDTLTKTLETSRSEMQTLAEQRDQLKRSLDTRQRETILPKKEKLRLLRDAVKTNDDQLETLRRQRADLEQELSSSVVDADNNSMKLDETKNHESLARRKFDDSEKLSNIVIESLRKLRDEKVQMSNRKREMETSHTKSLMKYRQEYQALHDKFLRNTTTRDEQLSKLKAAKSKAMSLRATVSTLMMLRQDEATGFEKTQNDARLAYKTTSEDDGQMDITLASIQMASSRCNEQLRERKINRQEQAQRIKDLRTQDAENKAKSRSAMESIYVANRKIEALEARLREVRERL